MVRTFVLSDVFNFRGQGDTISIHHRILDSLLKGDYL